MIQTNMFNQVEYIFNTNLEAEGNILISNVDIQILKNDITGERSVGWVPVGTEISNKWRKEVFGYV